MANTLAQLLKDPIQLQKWKTQAKQNLERFSATRVNDETLAVYSELIDKYNVINVVRHAQLLVSK